MHLEELTKITTVPDMIYIGGLHVAWGDVQSVILDRNSPKKIKKKINKNKIKKLEKKTTVIL
jgi:hypothetical protein